MGKVSRAGYYKWLHREPSAREIDDKEIAKRIEEIYKADPAKGYRRIANDLRAPNKKIYPDTKPIAIGDGRVLHLCRVINIKSTIKYAPKGCTQRAIDPAYIAENILNREFKADAPNQKWCTDVSEFHYYEGVVVHKVYLSAIIDLYDRRIVSYVISNRNDKNLVFNTFNKALLKNPGAHPLFHSDRGFQYTCRDFRKMILDAGMTQSMSRIGKCIDNGPMEGFWGMLKRERYYTRDFDSRKALVTMINNYMEYYNSGRLQRNLGRLTPMQKHNSYQMAA
ncbi:MAG: IS3 family transposase [Acidaminococcus provencensis]|nr:IS3 family transposase [Acidaminococcus provencensis]